MGKNLDFLQIRGATRGQFLPMSTWSIRLIDGKYCKAKFQEPLRTYQMSLLVKGMKSLEQISYIDNEQLIDYKFVLSLFINHLMYKIAEKAFSDYSIYFIFVLKLISQLIQYL